MPDPRRLPPPWSITDYGHCFTVKDANGVNLANVPYRIKDVTVGSHLETVLDQEEARRVAVNIAKLPSLLGKA
jgi:hypothetical protein